MNTFSSQIGGFSFPSQEENKGKLGKCSKNTFSNSPPQKEEVRGGWSWIISLGASSRIELVSPSGNVWIWIYRDSRFYVGKVTDKVLAPLVVPVFLNSRSTAWMKTGSSRACKPSWPLAKPLAGISSLSAATSVSAESKWKRIACCVSRADLVGRLWANKNYSKTKQEDCVSSTDSHHCLFVTSSETPGRAFQAGLADAEEVHRFSLGKHRPGEVRAVAAAAKSL